MFTAKDMAAKLQQEQVCVGIDNWLQTFLFKKFSEFNKQYTTVGVTHLFTSMGWSESAFTNEMAKRGFSVKRCSDQRDGDYYEITFPPQSH